VFGKEKAEGLSGFQHGLLHLLSPTVASHLLHFLIFIWLLEIHLLKTIWPKKYCKTVKLFRTRIFIDWHFGMWSLLKLTHVFQHHTEDLYGLHYSIQDQRQTQTAIF
jgi:hypothetical protein